MGLISRIRSFFMGRFSSSRLEKVFDIRIQAQPDMGEFISDWQKVYQGNPDWVGPGDDQIPFTIDLASTIACDIATKATSEVSIMPAGSEDALLEDFIREEILSSELRRQTEYGLAMGAFIARPYFDVETQTICLSWYSPDLFVPVAWKGRRCISGIFIDQFEESKGDGVSKWYTKLELQKWTYGKDGRGGSVDITVKAFSSDDPNELQREIPLSIVPRWADITASAHIDNLTSPLFVYASTPFSNNKSLNSKIGVSLYKDGMAHLQEIDRTWCALQWEREFTEGKVFVDQDMLPTKRDKDGVLHTKINGKDKRIYAVMEANGSIPKFMEVFAPNIRQGDIVSMLKTHLSLLCTACHLDSGAYIYDEATNAVTATEVRTKNQQTYQTIVDVQNNMLTPAIDRIVEATRQMQLLYGLPSFRDGLKVNISYGDSILIDTESDKQNAQRETQMGLRSKLNYLMEYRGLSEEDARRELELIDSETPQQIDFFGGGNG